MDEKLCSATRTYPYLDDWTDEADEWHDEGEVRPLFGIVRQSCLRPLGHVGEHQWPDPVIPKPTRHIEATFLGPGASLRVPRIVDTP